MPDTIPSTVSTPFDAAALVGYRIGVGDAAHTRLTHGMRVGDAGVASLDGIADPAVRPALAFRVARRIDPDTPHEDIEPAIAALAPAVEVLSGMECRAFAVGPWRVLAGHLDGLAIELVLDDRAPDPGFATDGALEAALSGILAGQRRGGAIEEGAVLLIGWADRPSHRIAAGSTVVGRTEHVGQVSFFTQD